jgi:Fe-S-cluster containining protein
MNIRKFALNLEKVYGEMAQTFSAYQSGTGLACPPGCGRCCTNPEIEASVLEMIPVALKIHDQGKLEEWLQKLEEKNDPICMIFEATGIPGNGRCSFYQERPSVCRMFGVAGTYDKHHQVTHTICKFIKELNLNIPQATEQTPLIPLWSTKLTAIDPDLIKNKLPINLALRGALEKIAFYSQYQII